MRRKANSRLLICAAILALCAHGARAARPVITMFAAASLADALQFLADDYQKASGARVKVSFAASSALARQIEGGAPADLFVSADRDWMDYLQSRHLIRGSSRSDLLGNSLVLIAPADSRIHLDIAPQMPIRAALGGGRLAIGDPDSVPVGRYARAALQSLGVWKALAGRLVRADNVRVALEYVARGEVPLGIVYKTDALIEKNVRIVGAFPASSHPPIVYPIALTAVAKPAAAKFLAYLRSPASAAVFARYGFTPLPAAAPAAR
ncbi:MAG TPA: molybdate ABC transporter substrate-binding protein [Steroidobacteraceae bacterium]|nr:molybdate ABC transporter substrate-binding protein [Steroidobacteraceae bacterium]